MSTFQRCPDEVKDIARELLFEFATHQPLIDAKVSIDYVFAYPSVDENGEPTGPALTKNGVEAIGLCRILPLKDRAMGRADAEISLDGNWWKNATAQERRAVLDHELHHISVKTGFVDDLRRPKLKLRKHDVEVGWFAIISERHGRASIEQTQAAQIMDSLGQYFWPLIASFNQPSTNPTTSARKVKVRDRDGDAMHVSPAVADLLNKTGGKQ